ncbi:carbon-nitrogen hydrolase family protein [Rhodovulum sp. FJ3]|uniref:carbon-nitrogen hydrolase family protein n=1 Tax=Rhodovulum sp. FJ3 TaxID=3079053 RepID=UPI00293DA25A|nr:carbon-nitrogen hydrolase family protein [Rhodovulum sp. FJ3]MDV4169100.1 carbon-nitrogen hydrolase family protein [Rhodovulum sp. FJ3]
MTRLGLIQMCAGDDPAQNARTAAAMVNEAADQGAEFVLTPEVTNCLSSSRTHQRAVLTSEDQDITLSTLRDVAAKRGVWVLIGSLGLTTDDADGRFANRSFLITPTGEIAARYDKIHMFDVDIGNGESFRESDGYRPGDQAVVAQTDFAPVGMSICYDVRFPYLYRDLAQAGAQILTVPAAFHPVTGAAHWHVLLRARAIETGCFVVAPAQTGTHPTTRGKPRQSYGHSLVVAPWGDVLADGGTDAGIVFADIDLKQVAEARKRVPSLTHDREFKGPARV